MGLWALCHALLSYLPDSLLLREGTVRYVVSFPYGHETLTLLESERSTGTLGRIQMCMGF